MDGKRKLDPRRILTMAFKIFIFGFLLCNLDAFSLGGVPVPWIGFSICVLSSISNRWMPFRSLSLSYLALICLLAVSTALYSYTQSPNSYLAYRFFNLVGFLIIVNYIVMFSAKASNLESLDRWLVGIGVFSAVIAVGVFALHVAGLGDIPRNRIGTGGMEQAIIFTFEIGGQTERALGAFREPSFLAMALILPGIIALRNNQFRAFFIILTALYLTYSFGAVFSLLAGVFVSLCFCANARRLVPVAVSLGILLFSPLIFLEHLLPDNIYIERLKLISSIAVSESSRGYIYENLSLLSIGFFTGGGVGSLAFGLADVLGVDHPVSVLNLYLSVLSSAGVLALLLLLYSFIFPNFIVRRYLGRAYSRDAFFIVLPANVFLFLYLTSFEELHIWHAVSLGILLGRIRIIRARGRTLTGFAA